MKLPRLPVRPPIRIGQSIGSSDGRTCQRKDQREDQHPFEELDLQETSRTPYRPSHELRGSAGGALPHTGTDQGQPRCSRHFLTNL